MPASRRRVAVIGAGPSGLTAIRQALQHGHDVCAFEQLDGIGGVWKMAVDPGANRRPVSALSALPVSKELCAFSDFPVPDDFPTFLRPADALAYLQLYAEKFSLNEHIRLGTEVLEVRRASGWESNGKWLLRLHQRHGSGEEVEEEEEFDAVLMCTGMRQKGWRPPEWRLEKQFKGRVLHSEQFTSPADFRDQTVVVVGLGNSAVEIASGLAPIAKQVFLSTRRGGWLLNRLCPSSEPWDRHFHSRFHSECRRWLPKLLRGKLWQWSSNRLALLPLTSQGVGQLPAHSLFSSHLTFGADQLGWHLATGRVRLRPDIWSLSADNSVEFVDGSMQHGVDTVLLCTGFQFQFGLVEQGTLLPVRHNDFHLYKHMFAPELAPHHNLAVIGHVQTVGGCVWPVAELQTRLFFQVLEEKAAAAVLPSPFWMKAELEKRRCALSVGFLKTRRHTQMEDHVQFCVELAEMFGASPPPFHRLFLSDPRLALAILFGPFCAAQFRIWGPHRQSEAEARNLVLKTAGNGGNNNLLCHWHCPAERSLLLMAIGLAMALFCSTLSTVLTQSIT